MLLTECFVYKPTVIAMLYHDWNIVHRIVHYLTKGVLQQCKFLSSACLTRKQRIIASEPTICIYCCLFYEYSWNYVFVVVILFHLNDRALEFRYK